MASFLFENYKELMPDSVSYPGNNNGFFFVLYDQLTDAIAKHDHQKMKIVLSKMIVEVNGDWGTCELLHWSCTCFNYTAVKELLKIPDININYNNKEGYTPLVIAAAMSCIKISKNTVLPEGSWTFDNGLKCLKLLLSDPRTDLYPSNKNNLKLENIVKKMSIKINLKMDGELMHDQLQLIQNLIKSEKETNENKNSKNVDELLDFIEGTEEKLKQSKKKKRTKTKFSKSRVVPINSSKPNSQNEVLKVITEKSQSSTIIDHKDEENEWEEKAQGSSLVDIKDKEKELEEKEQSSSIIEKKELQDLEGIEQKRQKDLEDIEQKRLQLLTKESEELSNWLEKEEKLKDINCRNITKLDELSKEEDYLRDKLKLIEAEKKSTQEDYSNINLKLSKLQCKKVNIKSYFLKEHELLDKKEKSVQENHEQLLKTFTQESSSKTGCNVQKEKTDCGSESKSEKHNFLNQQLAFFDEQIDWIESHLECPVCLETASSPIYQCQESHLICDSCRPQVASCPECRITYKGPKQRNRYAENDSLRLGKIKKQKEQLLLNFTSCLNYK